MFHTKGRNRGFADPFAGSVLRPRRGRRLEMIESLQNPFTQVSKAVFQFLTKQ